jgi:hypothetical protein
MAWYQGEDVGEWQCEIDCCCNNMWKALLKKQGLFLTEIFHWDLR